MTDTDLIPVAEQELAERLFGHLTPISWEPPEDRDLTFEEWDFDGGCLSLAVSSVHFWIGDWLNYGFGRFQKNDKYCQAIDETRFQYGTLRNDSWVAANVPKHLRIPAPTLYWYHHYLVASYSLTDIDRLLKRAAARRWTTRQLNRFIKRWRSMWFGESRPALLARGISGGEGTGFSSLPAYQPSQHSRPVPFILPWKRAAKKWYRFARHWYGRAITAEEQLDGLKAENAGLYDKLAELAQHHAEHEQALPYEAVV